MVKRLLTSTAYKLSEQSVFDPDIRFKGVVLNDRFRLCLKVEQSNGFIPFVTGTIDPTVSGSILSLRYNLFPGTRLHLSIWIFVTFIIALLISFYFKNFWPILPVTIISVTIFFVAWVSFNTQLKHLRKVLYGVLS